MVSKTVAPGEVVSTDRYSSTVKALDALAEGGSLFLVTVRPPDEKLWLVAILESPKKRNDGWYSKANATPIADITAAISKLQFANGAGLKAKKGALGMSLQTPRTLTDADAQLLRSFVAGSKGKSAPEAYAKAVAATPAAGKTARRPRSRRKKASSLCASTITGCARIGSPVPRKRRNSRSRIATPSWRTMATSSRWNSSTWWTTQRRRSSINSYFGPTARPLCCVQARPRRSATRFNTGSAY